MCADWDEASVPGEYDSPFENPYFYLYVCSQLASSIYTYTWDIKMDWGLFDKNAGDNRFLREELVYSTQVSRPLHSATDTGAKPILRTDQRAGRWQCDEWR